MTNRSKAKGTAFERLIADYLAAEIDDRIDRRPLNGSTDKGDIGGLRISAALTGLGHSNGRVVVEAKNHSRLELGVWVNEADVERGNDDALAGVVVHKRRGTADPGDQYCTMTVRDLVALITGRRP